jgi:DNA recombination protein RmuC
MLTTVIVCLGVLVVLSLSSAIVYWQKCKMLEGQLARQVKGEKELSEAFKGLAASALETSMGQFLNLAQSTFSRANETHKLDSEQRHKKMDELIKPVTDALSRYQQQIDALEKDRVRAFQAIDSELKRVTEGSVTLARETTALKDALKRPHVRGRWGEVQLRNCIDLAGMSEYADVTFQSSTTDEEGARHQPDMVVRMPGGRNVIVDAKTPIDAFLTSLEATTAEARGVELARHGKQVKAHVMKLSTRAYAESVKDSADFTVLFLPNESFLYAALESEPDIVEFAIQKKVLIATPPTLVGLLKVIRFGWNEQKLAENAQKISLLGQELHKRVADFTETYENIGKHLEKAKDAYDQGRMRLESKVLVQARRFEALGAKSNKTLLESGVEIAADSEV